MGKKKVTAYGESVDVVLYCAAESADKRHSAPVGLLASSGYWSTGSGEFPLMRELGEGLRFPAQWPEMPDEFLCPEHGPLVVDVGKLEKERDQAQRDGRNRDHRVSPASGT